MLKSFQPYNNVAITNTSFPSSTPPHRSEIITTSAYVLPSFKYIPFLPRVSFDSVQALVKGYLLPKKLNAAHDKLSPIHRDRLTRSETSREFLPGARDVKDILVLICGHGGRDMRCGITGPILQAEFEKTLQGQEIKVEKEAVEIREGDKDDVPRLESGGSTIARVGLISHIGGHKFAGNVIIYIPPNAETKDGPPHPFRGCGIWYGRVEPKHVDGIVRETIMGGKVIEELFRGGIAQDGEILRL